MIRFLLQRLLVGCLRLIVAAIVLLAAIELGFVVLGGRELHAWELSFGDPVPPAISPSDSSWGSLLRERFSASARVLGIAFGGALLIGYSWGLLAARLRRLRAVSILVLPWAVLACAPGFWLVILVAVYSVRVWRRPGFAGELVVETGPDLLSWWNAGVVAIPALGVAASLQLRRVCAEIETEAGKPLARALFLAGFRNDEIFYGNVLGRSRAGLIASVDEILPWTLGSLICLEWAFRYNGIGSLLVESAREGSYVGLFLGGMVMAGIVAAAILVREWALHFAEKGRG